MVSSGDLPIEDIRLGFFTEQIPPDVKDLVEDFLITGEVKEAIAVEEVSKEDHDLFGKKYKCLYGNRRLLACFVILRSNNTSVQQKKSFSKIPCIIYSDLTGRERYKLLAESKSVSEFLKTEKD